MNKGNQQESKHSQFTLTNMKEEVMVEYRVFHKNVQKNELLGWVIILSNFKKIIVGEYSSDEYLFSEYSFIRLSFGLFYIDHELWFVFHILFYPGHDIKLHPHRVKLYWIGCVGSGLVLAKALT